MDTTETTKAVLQRYHDELWVNKNTAVLAELVDDGFTDDTRSDFSAPGPEYAKGFFDALFTAFPDLESVQEQLVAEGDLAAIRWTLTGTMTGPLFGYQPTGKRFKVTGIDLLQVRDGRITRDWGGMADQLPKVFQQLGLS
ncbi:MAG TPA: ester cyclase [Actinomycetes bacterium]|nr:ester cyclase [Actinomycetes bacterium]